MSEVLKKIREVIELEKNTLNDLLEAVDDSYEKAVRLILESSGKVIFSGMGKSGHIANKIVATFSSTGTPAVFLHPSEALHGDLGIVGKGDVLVLISKSGESDEIIGMLPSLRKLETKVIGITANLESTLAQNSDVVLYTPIEKEACTLNLAPTSSVIAALAVGDALAVTLMDIKKFSSNDFALYHPAGRIGKRLLYQVDDLMRKEGQNPVVDQDADFETVLTEIARGGANALSVKGTDGQMKGLITGFDIRKAFGDKGDLRSLKATDLMFEKPVTIESGTYAVDAYDLMKNSPKPLNVLPVLKDNQPVGMLTLQDMVRAGL